MTAPASPAPEAIKAARAAAGLTQTQAAAMIYCTLRGWQDWEGGKRAMHPAFFEFFLQKAKKRIEDTRNACTIHPMDTQ